VTEPDTAGADPGPEAMSWGRFWRHGPLPPAPADDPEPAPAPARLGRPEITVDGRNLGDVLRPVWTALTARQG
jgi:hypothetical protein